MNKKVITTIAIITSFFLFQKVNAAVVEKQTSRTFSIQDQYIKIDESRSLKVNQNNWVIPSGNIEGFTIFYPLGNDKDKDAKISKTKTSITVTSSDGTNLSFTTEPSQGGNLIVKVKIPRDINFGETYTIDLKYNSYGLMLTSGNLRDIYVPAFAKDYVFQNSNYKETVTTAVQIPKSFGDINFITPENSSSDTSDMHIIKFSEDKLVGQTAWIEVGTKQFYSFEIDQKYEKTSDLFFAINTYKVIIPRDIADGAVNQKVFFSSISPKPDSISEDVNGNIVATFSIKASESGTISIKGYSELDQDNKVDFKDSGKLSDIPQDVIDNNTKSAQYWESDDPLIKKTAADIIGNKDPKTLTIYDIAQKTYAFVVNKIDYSNIKRFGINERKGALATLKGGAAVCMEYSDLFIALMRANGIPARAAFGFGYSALDDINSSENASNHQWAEIYIPSISKWIGVDITWGENGNQLIGGDLNHFYTHVASVSPDDPSTTEVKFYGTSSEIPDRTAKVIAISKLPDNHGDDLPSLMKTYPAQTNSDLIDQILLKLFPQAGEGQIFYFKALSLGIILITVSILIIIYIKKKKPLGKPRDTLYTE